MTKPTRDTIGGRAYLDLRAQAIADGRATGELLQLYALEGFLARIAQSVHASNLILKGGVLLAAYDLRRPTRDVDLLAQNVDGEIEAILALIKDIMNGTLDDGCVYGEATAEVIREDDAYQGIRVRVPCTLAGAKVTFHVDVNVGDPVWPTPSIVNVARLLGGSVAVRGYPLSMVFAEKLVTAVQRGIANTRWRDFADLYLLAAHHSVSADELLESIARVATHRQVVMLPLAAVLAGYEQFGQAKWFAWRNKQHLDDRLPAKFAQVLTAIQSFADPLLGRQVIGRSWDPDSNRWS